jgi:hypothetical protein
LRGGLVNLESNDPDTLQALDESNSEWVECWSKATNKKRTVKPKLSFNVIQNKKEAQLHQKKKQ